MWLGHCLWINDCLFVEFHRNINCFISWTLNHVDLNFQVIICSCKIYVESVLFVTKQPFDAECGQLDAGKRLKIERFIESALYVTKQPFVYEMKPYCKWSPRVQSSKICIMHTCWVLGGSSAARVMGCICSIRQCRMATRASNEGPNKDKDKDTVKTVCYTK